MHSDRDIFSPFELIKRKETNDQCIFQRNTGTNSWNNSRYIRNSDHEKSCY